MTSLSGSQLTDVAVTVATPAGSAGGAIVGTDAGAAAVHPHRGVTWLDAVAPRHIVTVGVATGSGDIAVGDVEGTVTILRAAGGATEVPMGSRVRSLAWSPDGELLALCSQLGGVVVVDAAGRRCAGLAPSRRWRHVAWQPWSHDAPLIVAGAGGAAWVAAVDGGSLVRREAADGVVTSVAVDPAGPLVAFGDLRGEVRIVDVGEDGGIEVSGWPDPLEVISWMPGTGWLLVAGGDEVTAWTAAPPEDDGPEPDPPRAAMEGGRVTALAPHPRLECAAVGTEDGGLAVWQPSTGSLRRVERSSAGITTLVWDALGEWLFVGTRDGGSWRRGLGASG